MRLRDVSINVLMLEPLSVKIVSAVLQRVDENMPLSVVSTCTYALLHADLETTISSAISKDHDLYHLLFCYLSANLRVPTTQLTK